MGSKLSSDYLYHDKLSARLLIVNYDVSLRKAKVTFGYWFLAHVKYYL